MPHSSDSAHLAADLHVHLVKVPSPLRLLANAVDPLSTDLRGEHQAEPVPPEAHRLVANVDATLGNRSSTVRNDRGYFTKIITTSRITSGDELKQRNGLGDVRLIRASYRRPARRATFV